MPSSNRYRNTASAAKFASKYASKAVTGLARWATTDHTGTAKLLANLPPMGFLDTIAIVLVTVASKVFGPALS